MRIDSTSNHCSNEMMTRSAFLELGSRKLIKRSLNLLMLSWVFSFAFNMDWPRAVSRLPRDAATFVLELIIIEFARLSFFNHRSLLARPIV